MTDSRHKLPLKSILKLPRTLADWLIYLESELGPEFSMRPGLDRSRAVWSRLKQASTLATSVVIVAGSNGKGSTGLALAELARASGLRTGLYASPHISRFNERLVIDGMEASDRSFCDAFERVELARLAAEADKREPIALSYYEFTTLAAFSVMELEDLDLAVLEVGLGGRLDTVNLIDADVSVLTRVGLDHEAILGDTLEAIGAEKAGVFRQQASCVFGTASMPESVWLAARQLDCHVQALGRDFTAASYGLADNLTDDLTDKQPATVSQSWLPADNLAAACAAFEALGFELPVNSTELLIELRMPGRLQLLQSSTRLLIDAAHNGQAAGYLADWLEQRPWLLTGRVRAVFSCFADKNAAAMLLPLLPIVADWHLFELDSPRAASMDSLVATLSSCDEHHQSVMVKPVCHRHTSGQAALSAAMDGMGINDCVLAFGSFMVVESMLTGWQSRLQKI